MSFPNHIWTVHKLNDEGEWRLMGRFVSLELAERFMAAIGGDAMAEEYEG